MLKVGHPNLIKAKLGTLGFQRCTLIVLYPKGYELGHIDLISCKGLKSPIFDMCHSYQVVESKKIFQFAYSSLTEWSDQVQQSTMSKGI